MRWDERVGKRIKLRDLHLLEAAAQTGSLAKAAKSVGMSQPAVSYAIAEMEKLLGVSLLDRTSQGVAPTAFAHALLKRSAVIFNELRGGLSEIESLSDPTIGELRIGTPQPMLSVTSAVIDRMSDRYPRMTFHLTVESTHVLLRDLRDRADRAGPKPYAGAACRGGSRNRNTVSRWVGHHGGQRQSLGSAPHHRIEGTCERALGASTIRRVAATSHEKSLRRIWAGRPTPNREHVFDLRREYPGCAGAVPHHSPGDNAPPLQGSPDAANAAHRPSRQPYACCAH